MILNSANLNGFLDLTKFYLQSWEQWFVRKLSGRSYGSQVKEKLRSYEIQLQLLEEEEARLLRLIEEQQSKSLDRKPEQTTSGLESLQRIENDLKTDGVA